MPEPILLPNGVTVVGKPFPRLCARCRTKSVWPVKIPYQGRLRYEDRLYTIEVPEWVVPRCETCGELHIDNYADDQINQALRAQVRLLTPEQIRGNRTTLNLGQDELAARIGVDVELVRRWEEDLAIQSRVQDNLLRLYFALPLVRSALNQAESGLDLGTAVGY
jgi:DNA-binding transcriptional regulator YiaG